MMKIPTWKIAMLLVYSCTVASVFMFFISLVFQWLPGSGVYNDFFGNHQLYIAFKMAVIGFILGALIWLSYYIPYRKRLLNR
ncbi:hypothetical protein LH23_20065 [Cedecea neteri]|uniref:Uncharacterized protein n=1 Tax=Cedecea neteri TaxID=158822 RepID=A0AAN0S7W1_9ENTR|nr:hypothetical protein [Cedecea neteri]AIR62869.1 hypothetical protein LH23_20065 [Cedecea neteri]